MQFIRILYDVFGFTPNSGLRLFGNAAPSPTSPVPQTQCSPTRGGGVLRGSGRRGLERGREARQPAGSGLPGHRLRRDVPSSCPPAALHASIPRKRGEAGRGRRREGRAG